jgi:enoyl-CoA hydratase/carnithine racemase
VELARTLASRPSAVLRVVKQNAAAAAAEPIHRILRREAQHQAPTFTDPAFQKKIRQMLEKPGKGTDR